MKSPLKVALLLYLVCLVPATVYANVVLPSLMYQWPPMIILLIPIATIEFMLLLRWLSAEWERVLIASLCANLVSTFVGVPLAWGFAWLLGIVLYFVGKLLGISQVSEPWLGILKIVSATSWLGNGIRNWMIPISMILWLVPCFFITVFIEREVCAHFLKSVNKDVVRKSVWKANLCSYLLLFALCIFALLLAVFQRD